MSLDVKRFNDFTEEVLLKNSPLELLQLALSLPEPSRLRGMYYNDAEVLAIGALKGYEVNLAALIRHMMDVLVVTYDSGTRSLTPREWLQKSSIFTKLNVLHVFLSDSIKARIEGEHGPRILYWDRDGYILTDDKEKLAEHKKLVESVVAMLEE